MDPPSTSAWQPPGIDPPPRVAGAMAEGGAAANSGRGGWCARLRKETLGSTQPVGWRRLLLDTNACTPEQTGSRTRVMVL